MVRGTYGLLSRDTQNGRCCSIEEGDLIHDISGDNPAGDAGEDVIHQVLGDDDAFKETGVLDGHSSLVCKGNQKVTVALGEKPGFDAIVSVDNAGDLVLDLEGDA